MVSSVPLASLRCGSVVGLGYLVEQRTVGWLLEVAGSGIRVMRATLLIYPRLVSLFWALSGLHGDAARLAEVLRGPWAFMLAKNAVRALPDLIYIINGLKSLWRWKRLVYEATNTDQGLFA
ncbi:hypothetical protein TcWFU_008748 [Taenia crassiceps]|uniref:Uncharacterized protein n=1 Tax=Taenia crassiceps TaxID=6207 RepID=A0ABR4Q410_9CEST